MGFAAAVMVALSDYMPVMHNDRTHHRVGTRVS